MEFPGENRWHGWDPKCVCCHYFVPWAILSRALLSPPHCSCDWCLDKTPLSGFDPSAELGWFPKGSPGTRGGGRGKDPKAHQSGFGSRCRFHLRPLLGAGSAAQALPQASTSFPRPQLLAHSLPRAAVAFLLEAGAVHCPTSSQTQSTPVLGSAGRLLPRPCGVVLQESHSSAVPAPRPGDTTVPPAQDLSLPRSRSALGGWGRGECKF
uniref:Uncharacterized protein n=1 Tax=Molossus molossus TaxID=27622 RepID=A0A7J8CRS1_MOLMO|nr:hypothetical protein HJG59_009745 [Molossus molossus]